ncbi:MAG: nucleotidyl transferase [Rhodospirillales bacterium]|jgi:mannose-1-phosphate guanylyltransferase|nr:nucleotidyl transferase [Rhodospirillales bacterium]
MACLADIDVVILAGGLGTRLRPVLADKPKVLAPIGARTFLDLLLDRLASFGARRVILSLGYLAHEVRAHLAAFPRNDMTILPLDEPEPLGTAGALRFARPHLRRGTILVLNGDSFVDADLCAFVAVHRTLGAEGTVLCARVSDAARFGTVEVDAAGRIVSFREKTGVALPGTINAGLYLMESALIERIEAAQGPSLERDVFQTAPAGTLVAHVGDFAFLDIGTPDDYAKIAAFVAGRGQGPG